jgi:outer membrane receptor protein involved in Fe transport
MLPYEAVSAKYAPYFKNGQVKGVVIDSESNIPIEYATVALYNAVDSSLITGTITESSGFFKITNISEGSYYLLISFIGFDEKRTATFTISESENAIDMGDIFLLSQAKELEEFNVVAEKRAYEFKIDKKIINVDKQLTAAGGTAVDVLETSPSVQVDMEGNVTLRGSAGFTVLVDGRPTLLDPNDILRQIPASNIDNIEIITNPSVKYNPDGATGIINIITKKNPFEGWSGIANGTVGRFDQYGGDFQLNYRSGKFNYFLGADYNKRTRPVFLGNNRITTSNDTVRYIDASGNTDRDRITSGISAGVEYSATENDFISLSAYYSYWEMNNQGTIRYDDYTEPQTIDLSYNSLDQVLRGGSYYEFAGFYQHTFPKKKKAEISGIDSLQIEERKGFKTGIEHKISMEAYYFYRDINEESTNQISDLSDVLFGATKNIENGPAASTQFDVNYVLPVKKEDKFEAGLQFRLGTSNDMTELYLFNANTGNIELIPEFTNNTDYTRNISAAYALYAGVQKKFGYQVGLRTEYTNRTIETANSDPFLLNRWDYFPTIHTSYTLKNDQQIMASYSRRIERPRSWWLEPFITWQDAYNVRQGNPALNPEYIDAFDFGYIKDFGKNYLSLEGYYRITNNVVSQIQSIYVDNVLLTRPENVGKDYSLGIEALFSLEIMKWWTLDISGNLFNYRMNGEIVYVELDSQVTENLDRESTNWNSRLNNTFQLWKNGVFQLNGRYNSASVSAQGRDEGYYTLDAAFKISFLEKSLSAVLQGRNILGTAQRESSVVGVDFSSYYNFDPKYPMINLSVTYRFNNFKSRKKSSDDGSGSEF